MNFDKHVCGHIAKSLLTFVRAHPDGCCKLSDIEGPYAELANLYLPHYICYIFISLCREWPCQQLNEAVLTNAAARSWVQTECAAALYQNRVQRCTAPSSRPHCSHSTVGESHLFFFWDLFGLTSLWGTSRHWKVKNCINKDGATLCIPLIICYFSSNNGACICM